jgi:hypothetical protein
MSLLKKALGILALFYLPLTVNANVFENGVYDICTESDCNVTSFYDYLSDNQGKYCNEKNFILNSEKRRDYLRYIIGRAEKYSLPQSVAMIPIIESSLIEDASSSSSLQARDPAIGMWQMKKGAATDMGLVVNSSIDERYDWKLATDGGLKYISWLRDSFDGDYNLAILAYNVGIGSVKRAIKRTGTRNAWYLSKLLEDGHAGRVYLSRYYGYYVTMIAHGVCENEK